MVLGPTYKWGDALQTEALRLSKFAKARTPHIVRMHKTFLVEEGQRTLDLDYGVVQRITLDSAQEET